MPLANVTTFLDPSQPAFSTESAQGNTTIEFPLGAAEPTAHVVKQRYWQSETYYARPAANTTRTSPYDGTTIYFIDDVDFKDEGGGMQTWTRVWASIPATWSEPGGTFAFTFPAYITAAAFGTLYTVTGIIANGNFYTANTNATGVVTGDTVQFDVNYIRASQNYHITTVTDAKFASSGSSITVAKIFPGQNVFSSVTGTVQEWSTGRSLPETIETDSILFHEYALGDPTTLDTVLPQVDKFSPVLSTGYGTDTLSTGTATTPNSATYASMIAAGTLIVARRSDRARYLGNIYERTTLMVKAR